jgi:hypothetical protein
MGIPVSILGESGNGKSCSLWNFEAKNRQSVAFAGGVLPF